MKKHVECVLDRDIALITMDSPPANAFTDPLHRDFLQILEDLRGKQVRAAIITGTGRFFQAGGDMHRFLQINSIQDARSFVKMAQDFMNEIAALSFPTIAAINGFALGGGLEIALACDIRIASRTAILGLPEVRFGILAGAGGTQRLSRLVGSGRAKMLMFTGRQISAEESYQIGLVDQVVDANELLPESFKLAEEIAANSPVAIRHVKKCVDEGIDLSLTDGLALERNYWANLIPYGDCLEGVNAWIEGRVPTYPYGKETGTPA
jgi:enoyl-CoA hydratase/carnithine racemase